KDFLYPRLDDKGHRVTRYSYHPPQSMPDGWPVGDLRQPPYSQSVSLGKLAAGLTNILRSTKSTPLDKKYKYPYIHSVVLVQSGTLLLDEYFYGYQPTDLQAVQSMTKSVFSALVGAAVVTRKLSPAEKVFNSFPKYDTDPKKKNISVRDLLIMSSGLDCNDWAKDSCSWDMVDHSTDWLEFALDKPGAYDAGTTFQYCGSCLNILSALVEKRTQMTIPDFAKTKLFGPLGITNATWWTGPAPSSGLPGGVITPAAFGLKIAARDLAKLGQLYLNQGKWWGGQTLLPPGWVKDSTTAWASSGLHNKQGQPPVMDYGYLWWTLNFPYQGGTVRAFYAFGAGMQYLFVVPDLQLVCLLTAGDEQGTPSWGSSVQSFFVNYILPAVSAPGKK
ncbi:MAG TPA: serine hydrolase, partial [bacterium]|nr:serine hydrolase [bacterium]